MTIDLEPELEERLRVLAERRSLSVDELIVQVLEQYLDSHAEGQSAWVETTQQGLNAVWPQKDFSDWQPPDAS